MDDPILDAIEHCRTLLNVLVEQRAGQHRPPAFANHTAGTVDGDDADEPSLAMEQY